MDHRHEAGAASGSAARDLAVLAATNAAIGLVAGPRAAVLALPTGRAAILPGRAADRLVLFAELCAPPRGLTDLLAARTGAFLCPDDSAPRDAPLLPGDWLVASEGAAAQTSTPAVGCIELLGARFIVRVSPACDGAEAAFETTEDGGVSHTAVVILALIGGDAHVREDSVRVFAPEWCEGRLATLPAIDRPQGRVCFAVQGAPGCCLLVCRTADHYAPRTALCVTASLPPEQGPYAVHRNGGNAVYEQFSGGVWHFFSPLCVDSAHMEIAVLLRDGQTVRVLGSDEVPPMVACGGGPGCFPCCSGYPLPFGEASAP